MKNFIIAMLMALVPYLAFAQTKKVYNEDIDPMAQIETAVAEAQMEGKYVICQVGGNWCPWCLRLADFVSKDKEISKVISDNYIYIHVNYPRNGAAANLMEKLGNPGRFGYPALVVLDGDGKVKHIQDSSFLEEGKGYDRDKVLRFLHNWVPEVAQPQPKTFHNPVIYADVPDVDCIRVGEDYWMVSTTNQYAPGAPIMHSTDLVHWETVNYIFEGLYESPKNNLEGGNVYSRGQWAASLRYHKGVYYCFFGTGVKSYLYRTTDPRGKWEMIWSVDEYLHDASFFIDDDDRAYLFYNGSHIQLREFYPDFRPGFNPDGVSCEVIHGKPEGLLEGSHLYKHDGKYYLTCIWWPAGGIRTQVCFRADKIDGNYADNMKVILQDHMGFFREGRYDGVAQGFFVDTPNGEWWSMMFQDHEAVGRIPHLMPLTWKDGWPMLGNDDGTISSEYPIPGGGKPSIDRIIASDEFEKPNLDLVWQWNHNPDNALWSLTERPGFLRLKTGKVVNNIFEARNTLTQRSSGPLSEGAVSLDVTHMKDGDHAGFSMFCSQPGTIEVLAEGGKKYLVMTDRTKEKARLELNQNTVQLRALADYTTDTAAFFYSLDGNTWQQLGGGFRMIFSTDHFLGNRFAIFNYSTSQTGGYVDVDWFHYSKK